MKKVILFLLIIFIIISLIVLIPFISAQVIINEVMPNPSGQGEWIELYSESFMNLIDWNISDQLKGYPFNVSFSGYAILACNADMFNQSYGSLGIPIVNLGCTRPGWLNNGGDNITLYDSSYSIIDHTTYRSFSNNKNWTWSMCEEWIKTSMATPSTKNNCPFFELYFPPYLIQNEVFAILMNISGYGNGIYDIKIDIKDQNDDRISRIWDENDEDWQSTHYYVDEVLNIENEQGDYHAFLKIDEDYNGPAYIYSKIRKSSTYENPIIYLTEIVDFSEQTSQEEEEEEEQDTGSFIEIVDAPENASFGDIVNVKLNVYRGDTGKYAVYVRVEQDNGYDVSEEAIIHVLTKYVNYTIKVPIQLRLNCNEKYSEEDYTIIVEGLDETTSQEIYLDGKSSLCSEQEDQEKNEDDYSYSTSETSLETTDKITGNVIRTAETEGSTVLKITPYLLSLLCLLIAFYVIKTK